MNRIIILFIFICLLYSCQTTNTVYSGSTGSRYGVSPFPSSEEWGNYIKKMPKLVGHKSRPSILWSVGTYNDEKLLFSFPGKDNSTYKTQFSNLDFNDEYLNYFDKNNIDVFLLIEPGFSPVYDSIVVVLDQYSNHKSVKGICIDLEWYFTEESETSAAYVTSRKIELWYNKMTANNKILMLKHWDINRIDPFLNSNIIYIQSLEGVVSSEDLKSRHTYWVRKFYPSGVGIEIGFKNDEHFWMKYKNPMNKLYEELKTSTPFDFSFYWNESTLINVIPDF